jgi:lipid-A-disaccharide synthase
MVVVYKLSPMTYRLGKRLAHVDTYAMVNLIAGERAVVELIQDACTPDAVAAEAVRLLGDQDYRNRMLASLQEVTRRLGGPGASDRAAEAILELVT